MEGAPILTLKCSQSGANQHQGASHETERYVFMKWDTFTALVGSAADRSEIAADLPSFEPKPWLTETQKRLWFPKTVAEEDARREAIQSAHQNPPKRKPKPNKLKGRGFGK